MDFSHNFYSRDNFYQARSQMKERQMELSTKSVGYKMQEEEYMCVTEADHEKRFQRLLDSVSGENQRRENYLKRELEREESRERLEKKLREQLFGIQSEEGLQRLGSLDTSGYTEDLLNDLREDEEEDLAEDIEKLEEQLAALRQKEEEVLKNVAYYEEQARANAGDLLYREHEVVELIANPLRHAQHESEKLQKRLDQERAKVETEEQRVRETQARIAELRDELKLQKELICEDVDSKRLSAEIVKKIQREMDLTQQAREQQAEKRQVLEEQGLIIRQLDNKLRFYRTRWDEMLLRLDDMYNLIEIFLVLEEFQLSKNANRQEFQAPAQYLDAFRRFLNDRHDFANDGYELREKLILYFQKIDQFFEIFRVDLQTYSIKIEQSIHLLLRDVQARDEQTRALKHRQDDLTLNLKTALEPKIRAQRKLLQQVEQEVKEELKVLEEDALSAELFRKNYQYKDQLLRTVLLHLCLANLRFVRSLEGLEPIFRKSTTNKVIKQKFKIYFDNHLFLGFKRFRQLLTQYLQRCDPQFYQQRSRQVYRSFQKIVVDERNRDEILRLLRANLAQDPFINHFLDDEKQDKIYQMIKVGTPQILKEPYTLNVIFGGVFFQGVKNLTNVLTYLFNSFQSNFKQLNQLSQIVLKSQSNVQGFVQLEQNMNVLLKKHSSGALNDEQYVQQLIKQNQGGKGAFNVIALGGGGQPPRNLESSQSGNQILATQQSLESEQRPIATEVNFESVEELEEEQPTHPQSSPQAMRESQQQQQQKFPEALNTEGNEEPLPMPQGGQSKAPGLRSLNPKAYKIKQQPSQRSLSYHGKPQRPKPSGQAVSGAGSNQVLLASENPKDRLMQEISRYTEHSLRGPGYPQFGNLENISLIPNLEEHQHNLEGQIQFTENDDNHPNNLSAPGRAMIRTGQNFAIRPSLQTGSGQKKLTTQQLLKNSRSITWFKPQAVQSEKKPEQSDSKRLLTEKNSQKYQESVDRLPRISQFDSSKKLTQAQSVQRIKAIDVLRQQQPVNYKHQRDNSRSLHQNNTSLTFMSTTNPILSSDLLFRIQQDIENQRI